MNKSLQYPAQVFFSEDDEGYIALAPDLAGCSAFGDSPGEALRELQDAIEAWIGAARKAGNPIPPPSARQPEELPSGKVLLRLPKTLHAQLIERARKDAASLNSCVIMLLSHALSEKQQPEQPRGRDLGLSDVLWTTVSDVDVTVHATREMAEARAKGLFRPVRRRSVTQGGSVLNVRTLPANKPVIVLDE